MDPKQGGVCQAVKTIINGLAGYGVHNEIVSLDRHDAPYLNGYEITIHALNHGKGPWQYNKRLKDWLLANLSYFNIVVVHGLWLYPGFAVRKALNELSKGASGIPLPRLFVMPHGMLDPYFQRAKGRMLKAVRNVLYWKLIESKLIHQSEAVLFTCQEELALASLPFRPYKPADTQVIGLGVDPPPPYTGVMKTAFLEACKGLNNAPYILFLSRIHEKKGLDFLVRAYLNVLRKTEEKADNIPLAGLLPKLIIAGPGLDSPFGKKIQDFVTANRELNQLILFPGMLTGNAKWGAFYGCDAFILPSHQENFGIAVVEALACGKPVLISDQVNIWREINEAGGCYVSSATLPGTEKLFDSWMRASYKQQQAMGRNALYAYKQYFSTKPTSVRILDMFTRALI